MYFEFICFARFSLYISITFINSINQLVCVLEKCCIVFVVRNTFLNTVETSAEFKVLIEFPKIWLFVQIFVHKIKYTSLRSKIFI
jgi:hypothetical protein